MYFNDWLSRRVCYTPDRIAVVDDSTGIRYTYRDLHDRARRLARHLRDTLGVTAADRVACVASNRIEYLDLYFACSLLGAILVPLNPRVPTEGLLELIGDCTPRVLVHETEFADTAMDARARGQLAHAIVMSGPDPERLGTIQGAVCDAGIPAEIDPATVEESHVAMILYTSGTTGRAKGAMITYRQIHWNALNTTIGLQLTASDVSFLNMPLHHTGGWHVLFTPLMLLGGRVVLQSRFDALRCNHLIGPEGITILFGIPTTLRLMSEAENFASADFRTVRFAIFGGESCPLPLVETYAARGVAMRQGYGLTEAGPNCFSLPGADATRKIGSIGFPNFHVGTRLVRDDGGSVGVGEVGELWMRGPHLFDGYWNDRVATAQAFHDGWFATGDLMVRDDEGYYFVVGRKKDMYVSGGENVYPAQVERVLVGHPAVAVAAVVGVPDPKWGETGWAFVQVRPGMQVDEHELSAWCRQRLARFQCPSRYVRVEELPLGTSGKIDKLALHRIARERESP